MQCRAPVQGPVSVVAGLEALELCWDYGLLHPKALSTLASWSNFVNLVEEYVYMKFPRGFLFPDLQGLAKWKLSVKNMQAS